MHTVVQREKGIIASGLMINVLKVQQLSKLHLLREKV